MSETPEPHGEIKVRDHKGYSIYTCADCGQDINSPGCSAKVSTQPDPPTFDSLLNDPTQQLDAEGAVLSSIASPAIKNWWCNTCTVWHPKDMGATATEAHAEWEKAHPMSAAVPEPTLEGQIAEVERLAVAFCDADTSWEHHDQTDDHPCTRCKRYGELTVPLVVEVRERAVEEALAEHRRDWAGWLDNWDGAVGPERPTIQAVVRWLRADRLPFGVAANPDAGGRP